MTNETPDIECHWCETSHPPDYLCPAAGTVLEKLREKGASYDAPTIELEDAVDESVTGVLCSAFSVKAFYTNTLQVYRPGVALQPVPLSGEKVAPFLLIDSETNIKRAGRLVDEMCGLAVRRARRAQSDAFKSRDLTP